MSKKIKYPIPPRPEGAKRLIFRASKTLPNGRKIYARDYGLRGFPIWI